MARAILILALLLTSGCVSSTDNPKDELASTPSPSRYNADPDKPKRVCEYTMEGNEPKTICY